MDTPMMKCGHAANATHEGKPCCVICAGTVKGWDEIAETPVLEGRKARCSYFGKIVRGTRCTSEEPSSTNLPFFEAHPDREFDEYYCGCYGWD